MKPFKGRGSTAPLILKVGTRWRVANFAPGCFTLEKERLYILNKRLVGPQGRSEPSAEEKDILLAPRYDNWTIQSVAQSLYRLNYPISIQVHTRYRRHICHMNQRAWPFMYIN